MRYAYRNVLHSVSAFIGDKLFLAAHVGSEDFGYLHRAVRAEVVFKERDKHSRRSRNRVVEGVSKILSAVLAVYAYLEPPCLSVAQIGAASHLEVFLLAGRPSLHVVGLDLKVGKVSRTALDSADGYIH